MYSFFLLQCSAVVRGGDIGTKPTWTSEIYVFYEFYESMKSITPPPGQIPDYAPVTMYLLKT